MPKRNAKQEHNSLKIEPLHAPVLGMATSFSVRNQQVKWWFLSVMGNRLFTFYWVKIRPIYVRVSNRVCTCKKGWNSHFFLKHEWRKAKAEWSYELLCADIILSILISSRKMNTIILANERPPGK